MSEKYFAKEKSLLTNKNKNKKKAKKKEKEKEKTDYHSLFGSNEMNNENSISKIKNLRAKKINNPKNSIDSNEQNLHKFFNYDLINSLNNVPLDLNLSFSNSDSSTKECISKNSNSNSRNNSSDNIKDDLSINKSINQDNQINEDKSIGSIINNDFNILNDPKFAPQYIPKKMRNQLIGKQNEKFFHTKSLNKFDDDNSKIFVPKQKKYKIPFEIRLGDWICCFCNNLNFAFRIKCNICGILKQNSIMSELNYYDNSNNINCQMNNYYDNIHLNDNLESENKNNYDIQP